SRKFLLIVCVVISVSGLILIYLASRDIKPRELKIDQINPNLIGKLVSVKGRITYVRNHPAGHVFLTISDETSSIEIPIFSSLMNQLFSNTITKNDFKKGRLVKITGIVGEYKDRLQIVPRKSSDLQFIN
ncbi:MAG: OB-fold nucleic acid binding domain-containing protein, partial [Candidatus Aenigmatarchaeota archaeon]